MVSGTEDEAQQVFDDLASVGHLLRRCGRGPRARGRARSSMRRGPNWSKTVQTALDEAKAGKPTVLVPSASPTVG